jgi:serine/threonine protein kinase
VAEGEAVCRRAIDRGMLSDAQARQALEAWQRQPQRPPSFADFLHKSGLVSRDQASALDESASDTHADGDGQADVGGATILEAGPGEPADPLVGQVFSACRIEKKLGQGGMGSVYLAVREADKKRVVVKFLAAEQAMNKTWRGRFEREASVVGRIRHPAITETYGIDIASSRPHIVMEFVDGEPLDEGLQRRGQFPPLEAARIARDMARGLAAAHDQGVVHRDIKPANVLLSRAGEVKVLDFGLAKSVAVDDGLSLPRQVIGTPHYMAPEQWGDHQVDARCDVFSLGATLYHLVTGVLPFPGHNAQAIQRLVLEGQSERPRALAPQIPEDLELVILRALEVERRFRYGSAALVADELDRVLAGQPVDVPRLVASTGQRHPLLPCRQPITLGRDPTATIQVTDPSVSRQHAAIERGKTGFVLKDLGSSYGTWVGDMRVREVVLKDGDPVRLGKVAFTFHDGGMGQLFGTSTKRLTAERMRVTTVPEPLLRALVDEGDKRVVVALLEELAPDAVALKVAAARATLNDLLDGDDVEAASTRLESRLKRLRSQAPMRLFTITHENLGDDVEGWLAWWDGARERFPGQIAPRQPKPRARLEVLKGEPAPRTVPLDELQVIAIGRDEKAQVLLDNRSVSRHHATILRFHGRHVLRDEGSRFGTLVNGQRVRLAFLGPGDLVVMGKVEMRFELDGTIVSSSYRIDEHITPVDDETFYALDELNSPAVVEASVRFLEEEAQTGAWFGREAGRVHDDAEKVGKLHQRVMRGWQRRAARAAEVLPVALGQRLDPPTPAGWRALLESRREQLPPQVVPLGWFPAAREPGTDPR